MERRRFALSWGRKIFFGLGWPLLCVLGLVFLKSGVLPKTSTSLLYYVVTSIGYYGLITSVLYFIFYVPLAALFPGYYFVRLWSAFLILLTGALLLVDAMVFNEYRFHINELVLRIFSTQGPAQIFSGSMSPYIVIAGVTLFLFFVLWIRGEWLWREMQRRFSNPVKNWYFILILVFMGISHLIHVSSRTIFYGNEVTVASLFPMNYQEIFFPKVHSTAMMDGGRVTLHYPKKDMKCKPQSPSNIILIVIENLPSDLVSDDATPFLRHLQMHGLNFHSHYSGGGEADDDLFRLFYGLPALFRPEAIAPVLSTEFTKAGYQFGVFSHRRIPGISQIHTWPEWKEAHKDRDPAENYFLFFEIAEGSATELDTKLHVVFDELQSAKYLAGSTIVVTATQPSDLGKVPMTFILPDRQRGDFDHRTTHFDVSPTLLKRVLRCSGNTNAYSFGKDLAEKSGRDWEIFGNENTFHIVDFANNTMIESDWKGRVGAGDLSRADLVLKAQKEISRFYR